MGKKGKVKSPPEATLTLPTHPSLISLESKSTLPDIIDTHTHLLSTFKSYRSTYPSGVYGDLWAFVRGLYATKPSLQLAADSANGEATASGSSNEEQRYPITNLVDVWCEAPITKTWKEIADSASPEITGDSEEVVRSRWGGVNYWFVMGVHPHNAKNYDAEVEAELITSISHPRSLGIGEIGLDYHYDNSPREIQQRVLRRQLEVYRDHCLDPSNVGKRRKTLVIHTREAEEDTERTLKDVLGSENGEERAKWKIHVHCFTDSPAFARRLLDYFPGLYIGITGVVTYATNFNTSQVIREMIAGSSESQVETQDRHLRILLETDAPYMVPSNLYESLGKEVKGRLPLCHTGMIPWTAEWVARVLTEAGGSGWDTKRVLQVARENSRTVYGL